VPIDGLMNSATWTFPLDHELTVIRARLIAATPSLRAAALLRNSLLQAQLALELRGAFPTQSALRAIALTGALTGAIDAVLNGMATGDVVAVSASDAVHEAAVIAMQVG
jgi:hypothetical protein